MYIFIFRNMEGTLLWHWSLIKLAEAFSNTDVSEQGNIPCYSKEMVLVGEEGD